MQNGRDGQSPRQDGAHRDKEMPLSVGTPDPEADPAEEIAEKGEPSEGNFA